MSMKARFLWAILIIGMLLYGASPRPTAIDGQIAELQRQVTALQWQEFRDQQEIARQGAWINYFYGQLNGNESEHIQQRDKSQDKF